jgi:hypothetical protein
MSTLFSFKRGIMSTHCEGHFFHGLKSDHEEGGGL